MPLTYIRTRPHVSTAALAALLLGACGDAGAGDPSDVAEVKAQDASEIADAEGEVAADSGPDVPAPEPYPDPGAWPPNRGPGGPAVSFPEEALYEHCAYLNGGEADVTDHHNLLVMYDGYLLMPWAPEWGGGGLTFFDVSDPCAPTVAGYGTSEEMRETHSIGFSHGTPSAPGAWAVVNQIRLTPDGEALFSGGVQFWDVSDTSAPHVVSRLELPGFGYPDAYARVTLSVFWQAPYVFAAGSDNGVYVIDASDPLSPKLLHQQTFDPVLRAGQVAAVGNLLFVSAAEGARTVLLDVSDPAAPQPIPGGDFLVHDPEGKPRESYFSNFSNGYAYYARKDKGGGVLIYDVRDPTQPALAGSYHSDGNGGYVFVKDDFAFVGESNFAAIYDLSDLGAITEVQRLHLTGDLDTMTPIGNVVVLSVDDKGDPGKGSAIAPWQTEPDATPPRVTWVYPPDGATGLAPTSRFGVTFGEMVDPKSAWEGSVRLYRTDLGPTAGRVEGYVSAQEAIVNFAPAAPLEAGRHYTLELPAGGVTDYNGNALAESFTAGFTVAGTAP